MSNPDTLDHSVEATTKAGRKIKSFTDEGLSHQYQVARVAEKNEAARMAMLRSDRLSRKLCDRATADNAMNSIVNAVRSALARVSGYLPSDLTGQERMRCEAAMRVAIQKALADAAAIVAETTMHMGGPAPEPSAPLPEPRETFVIPDE